jgi:hypothetical protein
MSMPGITLTDKLNAECFSDGRWKVNLLCNLSCRDDRRLYRRSPRLEFLELALIL